MRYQSRSGLRAAILFVGSALLLAGCGDGGNPADDPGISTTGEPLGEDFSPRLELNPRVVGETVPGQRVSLRADGDTASVQLVEWQQTGGPAVDLVARAGNESQFRVPPVMRDTSFSFRMAATDHSGNRHHRHVHVDVKALNWNQMTVVEPQLGGDFVVFRANKDNSLRVDLYRADLDGGNMLRLNGPLDPGGNVHAFSISPDRQQVAYLADEDESGVYELYLVDAMGGGASKLSGDLVAGGDVTADFQWSADSSRVAFRADKNLDESFELFAAQADGSPPLRLSGEMTPNGDVAEANFFWSDDSMHIAYRANQFNDNTLELFVSDREGIDNRRVSEAAVVDGGVLGNFAWRPGGDGLAYIGDLQSEDVYQLHVVDRDGGDGQVVSGPLAVGGSVLDFLWSPTGDSIAYRAEQLTDEVVELFSVNADGSDNTLVSALPVTGDVGDYGWKPDGAEIAYLADQDSDDVIELYVAGADGALNRRVSAPFSAGGDLLDFAWSPDGQYLGYRSHQALDNVTELYSATPDGAVSLRVSGAIIGNGDVVSDWSWSADSSWLLYRADQRIDEKFELFSSAPDGSANLLISGSLTTGGDVRSPEGRAFRSTADSTRVVYSADQQQDEQFELFVTSPDSGVAIASISGALTSGGGVRNFALANQPAAAAPLIGVQTNLPLDSLLGWEECFSNLYGDSGVDAIGDVLAACDRENLMLACREVGATLLTVAAWGPRAAVTADSGSGNVTNRANEVEWYFSNNVSWGFAGGGDAVNRVSCDTEDSNPEQRLCWHMSGGFLSGGYRCGSITGLNGSSQWERVMYHRTP